MHELLVYSNPLRPTATAHRACMASHAVAPTPLPLPSSHPSSPTPQNSSLVTTPLHLLQLPTSLTTRPYPYQFKPETRPASPDHSWTKIIRGHARASRFNDALSAYVEMAEAGVAPDNYTFPAVLKAAAGLQALEAGKQIHAAVIKLGYHTSSVTVCNTIVTLYGRCSRRGYAIQVFDRMPERDQVSWNSLITALCQCEEWEDALEAFHAMQLTGVSPSSFTLVSAALACSHARHGLRLGKQVHAFGLRGGHYHDKTFTINALMAMYAKLGRIREALALFYGYDNKDLVSWNTMISACTQNGYFAEALALVRRMALDGHKPDGVTIASVLPASSHLELLPTGKELHGYAMRNDDLSSNSYVGSALVDMYCNCGQVDTGHHVFDGISEARIGLWNAMIAGYTQNGFDEEALRLFVKMQGIEGLSPNPTTMSSVLPAWARSGTFDRVENIHGYVVKRGFGYDSYVQNALMDMYSRTGKLEIAKKIFENMEVRDLVSWNTMITAYVNCGHHDEALQLLGKMQGGSKRKVEEDGDDDDAAGFSGRPNAITLMTTLPACGALAALAKGREIHAYAIRNGLETNIAVGSALADMYARCGCLDLTRKVFDEMPKRNEITWNVLIMAYGMHGHGEEALKLFREMETEDGVKPNEVTFIVLFAACSHSKLVSEGLELFDKMKNKCGVEPQPDHYACIVDLLGRAGQLDQAYQLIASMPFKPEAGVWSSLLGACKLHGNIELGELAAQQLLSLEPTVASHYVLLSNIYASAGRWEDVTRVRKKMKDMGVKKEPGCSWIELGNEVHQFTVGDSLHPQCGQIYSLLERLSERMKKEGYVPDTSCVLHNVEEVEKEYLLCGHSEKLAIAFGIINTSPGTTIRITKNLRVCNDCHTATKYISKIEGRHIIVRDVRRFHHFKDGFCSCGDYW